MDSDVAGLVERLEAWGPLVASGYEVPAASKAIHEAASTIRALVAENEHLRGYATMTAAWERRALEAESKLREAVEVIKAIHPWIETSAEGEAATRAAYAFLATMEKPHD